MEEDLSCDLIRDNTTEFHGYLEEKLRYQWAEEDRNKNAAVLKKLLEQSGGFGIGKGPDFSVKELIVQDNAILIRCNAEESNLAYEHIRYMFHIEKSDCETIMVSRKNTLENLKDKLVDSSGILGENDSQRSASLEKTTNENKGIQNRMQTGNENTEKQSQSGKQQHGICLSSAKKPENPSRIGRNVKKVTKPVQIVKRNKQEGQIQEKTAKRVETPRPPPSPVSTSKLASFRKRTTAATQQALAKNAGIKMHKDVMTATVNKRTGNKGGVASGQIIPNDIEIPEGTNPVNINVAAAAAKAIIKKQDQKHTKILIREKTVDIKISKITKPVIAKSVKAAQLKNPIFKSNAADQNKSDVMATPSGKENPKILSKIPIPIPIPINNNMRNETGVKESLKEQSRAEVFHEHEKGSGRPSTSANQSVERPKNVLKVATLLTKSVPPMSKDKNPLNHNPAIIAKWNYQNLKRETKIGYNNPKSFVALKKDERQRYSQTPRTVSHVQHAQHENRKISAPSTPGCYHTPRSDIQSLDKNAVTPALPTTPKSPGAEKITKQSYRLIIPHKMPHTNSKTVTPLTPKTTMPATTAKRPYQTAKTEIKTQEKGAKATPRNQIRNIANASYQTPRRTRIDTPRSSNYQTPMSSHCQTPRKPISKDTGSNKDKQLPKD